MELAPPDKCSRKVSPCGKKLARVKFAYGIADNVTLPASSYQTQGPLPVATGNATLKWDAENRLIEVDRADGTKVCYSYDAQSRRISKKVGTGTATRYIYDGWNIIAEYNGATLGKKYTWGMDLSGSMQGAGGVGGLLAVNEVGGSTYYPTYDGNGNVSEYLDSSGAVQAHYEYDAFGNTTYSDGAKKNDFAHRFSTKPLDAETGLYYYGYRYYNPGMGRWLSRDPIGERGGYNLYGMVGNDLLNGVDILGLKEHQERERFDAGSFGKSVTQNYDARKWVRDKYIWNQLSGHWTYKYITDTKTISHTITISAALNVPILVNPDKKNSKPEVNMDVTVEDLKGVNGSFDTGPMMFTWSQKAIDRHAGADVINVKWSETETTRKVEFELSWQLPIDLDGTSEANLGFVKSGDWEVTGGGSKGQTWGVTLSGVKKFSYEYECDPKTGKYDIKK